jgi:hypothetical protein
MNVKFKILKTRFDNYCIYEVKYVKDRPRPLNVDECGNYYKSDCEYSTFDTKRDALEALRKIYLHEENLKKVNEENHNEPLISSIEDVDNYLARLDDDKINESL